MKGFCIFVGLLAAVSAQAAQAAQAAQSAQSGKETCSTNKEKLCKNFIGKLTLLVFFLFCVYLQYQSNKEFILPALNLNVKRTHFFS